VLFQFFFVFLIEVTPSNYVEDKKLHFLQKKHFKRQLFTNIKNVFVESSQNIHLLFKLFISCKIGFQLSMKFLYSIELYVSTVQ